MTANTPTLALFFGVLLIGLGLITIFLFSTRILVPAQPAKPGYWETVISPDTPFGRMVWHKGQPSQPEHYDLSFPNLPTGLSLISIGLAISGVGLFFQRRTRMST